MTELRQIYKCNVCGNIVEVTHPGRGTLVCCGQPMTLLEERTVDVGREKHVPVIEKLEDKVLVRVGAVEHPMEEKHYIEWIELIVNDRMFRKYLRPGMRPEAEFTVRPEGKLIAREYCNLHGLWKAEA